MENENLDYTQHIIRIKTNLEINRSTSYGSYDIVNKIIVVWLPKEDIQPNGKIKGYNTLHKQFEEYDLITLLLDLLEHESIHMIVHETEGYQASYALDFSHVEQLREEEEYFPEYAKSEGNSPSVIDLESKEQTRKQKERDNQNRW